MSRGGISQRTLTGWCIGVAGEDSWQMVLGRRGSSPAMLGAAVAQTTWPFSWNHSALTTVDDITRRVTPAAHSYNRLQMDDWQVRHNTYTKRSVPLCDPSQSIVSKSLNCLQRPTRKIRP